MTVPARGLSAPSGDQLEASNWPTARRTMVAPAGLNGQPLVRDLDVKEGGVAGRRKWPRQRPRVRQYPAPIVRRSLGELVTPQFGRQVGIAHTPHQINHPEYRARNRPLAVPPTG